MSPCHRKPEKPTPLVVLLPLAGELCRSSAQTRNHYWKTAVYFPVIKFGPTLGVLLACLPVRGTCSASPTSPKHGPSKNLAKYVNLSENITDLPLYPCYGRHPFRGGDAVKVYVSNRSTSNGSGRSILYGRCLSAYHRLFCNTTADRRQHKTAFATQSEGMCVCGGGHSNVSPAITLST